MTFRFHRTLSYLLGVFGLIGIIGCRQADNLSPHVFGGTTLYSYSSASRSDALQTIPDGARCLCYAEGSLQLDGAVLQLMQGRWQADKPFSWIENQSSTQLRMYYPVPDPTSFYTDEGRLAPLYCASAHFTSASPVSLTFKPIYARLTFQLPTALQEVAQTVTLKPTHALSAVIWATGEQKVVAASSAHTVQAAITENGCYSLDIPIVADGAEIQVGVTGGKHYRATYARTSWEAGREYLVALKLTENAENPPDDDEPGIRSSADFIEWLSYVWKGSVETNGTKYGTKIGDVWTYVLKKDLVLTDADNRQLQVMANGCLSMYAFNHIFDGNYHQISGLQVPIFSKLEKMALFPYVGKLGRIRNLRLANVEANFPSDLKTTATFTMGTVIAYNIGVIQSCVLEKVWFDGRQLPAQLSAANLGGLVGMQEGGGIVNCGLRQFTMDFATSAPWSVGAIVGTIRYLRGYNVFVDGFHVTGGNGGSCLGVYQDAGKPLSLSAFTHVVVRDCPYPLWNFNPPDAFTSVYYPQGQKPYAGFTSPKAGYFSYNPESGYLVDSPSVTLLAHLQQHPASGLYVLPWIDDGKGWVTFDFTP